MERINLKNITKEFKRVPLGQTTLKRIISLISRKDFSEPLKAIDDLSLTIEKSEIVGLIGDNGSGKSTILRIIAGIYKPTTGNVYTEGKIVSIIASTIKVRLSAFDNFMLTGSFYGLSPKILKSRAKEMIIFSDLEEFMDTQTYRFSDGMKKRLAFSVAIHAEPEILLLDEVFEVGDEKFKEKSANKIKELVSNGTSVVLTSHNMDLVKKHCTRVIWFKKGKIWKQGDPEIVVNEYLMEK